MKLVFKLLKIVGLLVGVLVVALGVLLFVTFSGGMSVQDGQRLDGVEVVKAIACAHSGLLTRGLAPLAEFAAGEK